MNKSERFKALLEKGYFPEELPPAFNTIKFAKYRESVFRAWSDIPGSFKKTRYEIYSYPRIGRKRRQLAIVNPISQLFLAKEIANSWVEIKKFIDNTEICLDTPQISNETERAVSKPNFDLVGLKKTDTAAFYDHVLFSDISRFYGTIYTHALPWALHTKQYCKDNLFNNSIMNNLLGDKLDKLVRSGQDKQTIGIPIGPDTSRILAEIIAVGIENDFLKSSGINPKQVFRYVDDWFLGFDAAGEAENAVLHLANACSNYELEINDEKTRIIDPVAPFDEIWPEELREHKFNQRPKQQAHDIRFYFTKAFDFASKRPKENVLNFALKRIRSVLIHTENIPLFENYVIRVARVNPTALPTAAQILINLNYQGQIKSMNHVRKLIFDVISKTAIVGKFGELSWSLFLAKGLGIAIPNDIIAPVLNVESSVCALITLDLRRLGLVSSSIDTSFWETFMTSEALEGNMWLLAYEANFKNWLVSSTNFVEDHEYFQHLKRKNISFYDTRRNVDTFKKSARKQKQMNIYKLRNTNIMRLREFWMKKSI